MIAILEKYNYRFDPANSEVLESATHSDSKKLIQYLIGKGYRVLPQTANGVAILESLLYRQYYDEYRLLSKGASTKQTNTALETTLNAALERCDIPQTKALIAIGARLSRVKKATILAIMNFQDDPYDDAGTHCEPMKAFLRAKGLQ